MIERYTRPAMGAIWTDENKYRCWLQVESAASTVLAEDGIIPVAAAEAIATKATVSAARVAEIEAEVKHDIIAFTTAVAESLKSQGLDAESRWLHYGLTSNDIVDSALALQVKEASAIIREGIASLLAVLKRRALEFKHTPTIGRTHGIHAEPTTFGLKLLNWYAEMERNLRRFDAAAEDMRVGKLSGAVGTFGHLKPEQEEKVCERLGLKPAPVATQVIQRDRHAAYIATLAIMGSTLDKIAVELRHLQRTEVREAQEYFSEKQKGSSAMPHKKNPITGEQISGLARVLRGNAQAALEDIPLWHERDISHSSVERVIFPDSTILADYLAGQNYRSGRPPAGVSRANEEKPRIHGRSDFQRAASARSIGGRPVARRGLPTGAVPRHTRLERRFEFPRGSGKRPRDYEATERREIGEDI